jgi:exodeoxyribonuclease VII large subunit
VSVYFQKDEQRIVLHGKTYPYRDMIRALGGQYQASDKTWTLPLTPEILQRVSDLCKSVGGGPRRDPAPVPSRSFEDAQPRAGWNEQLQEARSLAGSGDHAEMTVDGLTISELMHQAQMLIAQGFPRSLWVVGEIQNFRSHASGLYFQLADKKEGASRSATQTVQVTLWRSQLVDIERKLGRDAVRELLQDGIRVRLLVDVSLYKDRGQLSLQVQGIDPNFTKGSLALARERLLRELRAKGLDQLQKRMPLPRFPFHIGLITAPESRAQSDFIDQLRVYRFPGQISFYASQMQGERTLEEVVRGLTTLIASACDLIVVTRGGGSAADLRWFDSPEIAYAIAQSPVPIIAAIGHHEDVCVAEEICHQREKTPTAAADFIAAIFQKTRIDLDQLTVHLSRAMTERIRLQDLRLGHVREKLLLAVQQVLHGQQQHQLQLDSTLDMQIERRCLIEQQTLKAWGVQLQRQALQKTQDLDRLLAERLYQLRNQAERALLLEEQDRSRLEQQLSFTVNRAMLDAEKIAGEFEALVRQRDPQPWMAQGWTQLSDDEGRILSAVQLRTGQRLRARLPDARLHLKIESIELKNRT